MRNFDLACLMDWSGSRCKRDPLPPTPFMVGSGGGWTVIGWVVMDPCRV